MPGWRQHTTLLTVYCWLAGLQALEFWCTVAEEEIDRDQVSLAAVCVSLAAVCVTVRVGGIAGSEAMDCRGMLV